MDDYYSDSQPALIHCKFCGEDYAATYKYCPFCNTAPNGKKMGPSARNKQKRGGGARVRTNTRGGGYGGARSPLAVVGIVAAVVRSRLRWTAAPQAPTRALMCSRLRTMPSRPRQRASR